MYLVFPYPNEAVSLRDHSVTRMWRQIQHWLSTKQSDPLTGIDVSDACFWQADMHSHLLPGVDDGVTTPEQTLACLEQLAGWGIRHVVTTPHVSRDRFPDNTSASLRTGLTDLRALVAEHNLPLHIEIAAEYMLDDFFPTLVAQTDLLTFGPERYVLIETGFVSAPLHTGAMLFALQTAGYAPVLAHPERYGYYWNNEPALAQLRNQGCLFQLNWMSLVGRYGTHAFRQAQRLLQNGWVDFIGSDMHGPADLDRLGKLFASPDYALLKQQPLRNASLLTGV